MIKNLGIATGRRKCAVARVFLRAGSGKILVNGLEINEYFKQAAFVDNVRKPLLVTASEKKFDVVINVTGGGPSGQAGACRHGLTRAIIETDPDAKVSLKANGFLTRDPRMVERKKYGQRGARRRFQFSKR